MKWSIVFVNWNSSDPPPDVPPGQDEYPGIDYPEDEE